MRHQIDLALTWPGPARALPIVLSATPQESILMSTPVAWLLQFANSIDASLEASIGRLQEVFKDNGAWIEEQKAKIKREAEEKERQIAALKAATEHAAAALNVKKPRGRPKKTKAQLETAALRSESEASVACSEAISTATTALTNEEPVGSEENVAPMENVIATGGKRRKPAKAKATRGRPRKSLAASNSEAYDISSLSASIESLPKLEAAAISASVESLPLERNEEDRIPSPIEPEPVYVLAKPELSGPPLVEEPAYKLVEARTPAKPVLELELVNPPESLKRPRLSFPHRQIPEMQPSPAKAVKVLPPKVNTPKVESWTSQFLKSATCAPTVEEERPASPTVEPVIQAPPEGKPGSAKKNPALKANPALAHLQPEVAVESPLTRARRIDSQNTWREQQLSKFFVSKTEVLKSAMDTLKAVKDEERVSRMRETTISARETLAPRETIAPLEIKRETFAPRETFVARESRPAPAEPMEAFAPVRLQASPVRVPQGSPVQAKESSLPKARIAGESPTRRKSRTESPIKPITVVASPVKDASLIKNVSPLKTRRTSVALGSGPASPGFLSSLEAPQLDDTAIPDELALPPPPLPAPTSSDAFESKPPVKQREPSVVPPGLSEEERIKRQRLKERQQQAIEKRNAQIKKAQETRAKQEELFNPKPRPLPVPKGPATGAVQKPTAARPTTTGSSISGLHKAAIFNASKSNLASAAAANGGAGDFKTPAAKVRSPAPIKMAEKVVSSPMLPDIPSEDEECFRRAGDAKKRPDWATTPVLQAALVKQQNVSSDMIFDKVQPVRLEDIFKNKTFKRGRNSTIPFL